MKVQCDVCETAQATVLCCADEASLCTDCDTRVHEANKLASKHQRVPLLYPSSQDLPCCDLCQEKTGYFFCLEDRALLCRNCDFSIHTRNALTANHKRFLVSGVFVGLQAITTSEPSEGVQACSPSQGSSPTTHVGQLTSPTTHLTQRISPKNAQLQTSATLTFPSKNICLVPRESSSPNVNTLKEEVLRKVPPLSVAKQLQQQSSMVVSVNGDEALSGVPLFSTAKQGRLQRVVVASSPQKSQSTPTAVFSSKTGGSPSMSLTSASINEQMYMTGIRQPSKLGMSTDGDNDACGSKKLDPLNLKVSGCGNVGRSSISEYLTESVPGWRVDEFLNLPDFDSMYHYADTGISKTDVGPADGDWPAECSVSDSEGGLAEAVAAEVPKMPSPPTASGVPRLSKPWGFGKSVKIPDLDFFLHSDEPLVVPDIGGVSSPTSLSPSSLPQKRRRLAFEI